MMSFKDDRIPNNFWNRCYQSDSGCWIWFGATRFSNHGRYGLFYADYKDNNASKWILLKSLGLKSSNLTIDHVCRKTLCVNPSPDHLQLVTSARNSQLVHERERNEGRFVDRRPWNKRH